MRASHSWDNNPHHSHSPCEGPTRRVSIWIHAPRVEAGSGDEGEQPEKYKCQNFPSKCHVSLCSPLLCFYESPGTL